MQAHTQVYNNDGDHLQVERLSLEFLLLLLLQIIWNSLPGEHIPFVLRKCWKKVDWLDWSQRSFGFSQYLDSSAPVCRAQGFRGSKVGHSNQETVELRMSRGLLNLIRCSEPLQNLTQTTSSTVYCQRQSLVSQDSPLGDSWSNLRPAHNQHGAPERRKSGGVLLRPLLSLFPGAEARKVSKLLSPPSLTPGRVTGETGVWLLPQSCRMKLPSPVSTIQPPLTALRRDLMSPIKAGAGIFMNFK